MAIRIERLAAHHRRDGFDCDEPALNDFLRHQAGQLERRGFGKTYVALAQDGIQVLGFVTVSAGQIQAKQLSPHLKLPRYPAPVLRIGRLGVDQRQQGQGIGQQLMSFALQIALEFSRQVGVYAVVVDAKNDKAKAFYEALGFSVSLDDPLCLFLPVATLQKLKPL
jgi:GNAT superfamily N-acetyltransferase